MTSPLSEPIVVLLGTCDTKLQELLHVRSHIAQADITVRLVDVGRTNISHQDIDYTQDTVLSKLSPKPDLSSLDRGEVIKKMILAATELIKSELSSAYPVCGAICIGGSGGTSLGASVMRASFPIGLPKLIVSTVASGNVSNFIGETDITMMHSVVDIAGSNSILNPILENAAAMIAGAAKAYHHRNIQKSLASADVQPKNATKKSVAITMFGVTTPAVDAARKELESHGYEVFVFHATGIGGRAMETLIAEGRIDGVLDLTTTELADELVGGIMAGGPDRLTAASKAGIPQVLSLGALDIVNFGPRNSVPPQFAERLLYEHNPDITLLRTSPDECKILGSQIAEKLRTHVTNPDIVKVFIPEGGISMISTKGGPYYDKVADEALFEAVTAGLENTGIAIYKDARAINDEGLAAEMARTLMSFMQTR